MNILWSGSKRNTKLKYLITMKVLRSFQDIKINLVTPKKVKVMQINLKIFQKMGTSQSD
jgi:hypothetical protein